MGVKKGTLNSCNWRLAFFGRLGTLLDTVAGYYPLEGASAGDREQKREGWRPLSLVLFKNTKKRAVHRIPRRAKADGPRAK